VTAFKFAAYTGLQPSIRPRQLPDMASQIAQNLQPNVADFRPLQQDTNVATSAVNNPASLYRLARKVDGSYNSDTSTGWITSASVRNYVKGPLDDDTTERTYYTGSGAPRVLDVTGEDRLMGIPAPTEPVTIEVLKKDEFTAEDRTSELKQAMELALLHIKNSLIEVWRGPTPPGTMTPGLLDRAFLPTADGNHSAQLLRVFRLTTTNGTNYGPITNTYSTMDPGNANWVISPDLSPFYQSFGTTYPTWTGQTPTTAYDHICIPLAAYGRTYDCATNDLKAALMLIPMPGKTDGTKLLTEAQAEQIANTVTNRLSPTATTIKPKLDALRAKVTETLALFTGSPVAATSGTVASFYTDYANALINARITAFANEIFEKANLIANARNSSEDLYNPTVGTTSGVYKGGNRSLAVAAITAAANSYKVQLTDGSWTLNIPAMQLWIYNEGKKILENGEYHYSFYASEQQFGVTETHTNVSSLAGYIARENWLTHPNWPTATAPATGGAPNVAAVRDAQAQLKTLADTVTKEYDRIVAKFADDLASFYDSENIDAQLPELVVRTPQDRFYIFTYVDDWGQESAPSPVSEVAEVDQNDEVSLTFPSHPTGRNIVGFRLYRSSTASSSTAYQSLISKNEAYAELDERGEFKYYKISVTAGVDDAKDTELREVCPTADYFNAIFWSEPPENMRGLVGLPNGILAGFFDNTVCFSEPLHPYAWPTAYQMSCEHPIVGLGVFGQTLVVMHQGGVDYMGGADSVSMSAQRNISLQACVSARSIVSVEGGVLFASPDGLCMASDGGVQIVTEGHFTAADWRALNPSQCIGAFHEGTYYALLGSTIYMLNLPTRKLVTFSPSGSVSAMHVDRLTDSLYYTTGTSIVKAFGSASKRTALAKSKVFIMPKHEPLAWLQVDSEEAFGVVTVRWYGDGVLRHTSTVTSSEPVRLPPGRYREHEVEIESSLTLAVVTLASTTEELQSI
jgi:hypothetical protein